MPTTRKQQQKLQVDKSVDGEASLSHTTTSTKRKQSDSSDRVEDQSANATQDEGNTRGQDPPTNGDDDPQPPVKVAKVEESSDKQVEPTREDTTAASSKDDNAAETKYGDVQANDIEKKLEGDGVDTSGSGNGVKWDVSERGHIHFFYRPKVQAAEASESNEAAAKSIDDTQNFHMLLLPRSSDSSTAPAKGETSTVSGAKSEQNGEVARQAGIGARLIRLGKKRMPEPNAALARGDQPGGLGGDSSEAIWAVVSDVSPSFDSLKSEFAERRYSTKTSGARLVQAARPVGRGWYVISISQTDPPSSREVRLSYVLSHPHDDKDFGDVQNELGLHKESSVLLQMRNPTLPSTGAGAPPAGLDPSSRAEFSKSEIQETFGGNAESNGTNYARPEKMDLLDRAGVELLMIKKKEQEEEVALAVGDEQRETLQQLASHDASSLSNQDVLKELGIEGQNPPDALEGNWF